MYSHPPLTQLFYSGNNGSSVPRGSSRYGGMSPGTMLPHPISPPRSIAHCTHLTMTRLYGMDFICDSCKRTGPMGWVYRCTQDRDDLIEHAVAEGLPTCFDDLGDTLASGMSIRSRSPAARADALSFLSEITPEQMTKYNPEQIATILRQRQEVHTAIEGDRRHADILHYIHGTSNFANSRNDKAKRPWLVNPESECRYMICPRCRPGGADRAFISLNAVAEGEIPPTSAVGYGFHIMGERPVVDVEILKGIGTYDEHKLLPRNPCANTSSTSDISLMQLLETQLIQGQAAMASEVGGEFPLGVEKTGLRPVTPLKLPGADHGSLKHSPRCENLAAVSAMGEVANQGYAVRPPWTPPPSPSAYGKKSASETHAVGLAAEKSITDGRSTNSLKLNTDVRRQLLTSVPSTNALQRLAQSGYPCTSESIPHLEEEAYDVGLTLPVTKHTYDLACNTPLGPSDMAEEQYFQYCQDHAQATSDDDHHFPAEPLEVDHGVAVTEEGIELGVPDVITQV